MKIASADPTDNRALLGAFADALVSPTRSPGITEAEDIYAPLLGTWEVETRDHMPDGSVVTGHGEWLFARVLEGRAVQDVWIAPPRGSGTGRARAAHPRSRYGTSVRTLDPVTRRWQVTWFNPVSGAFDVLQTRVDGGQIVQEGTRPGGQRIRWVFDLLTPERFHWYGEAEQPDGRWLREAEFTGRRREEARSSPAE